MACLRGSIPCFTPMVVLHGVRASYICILLVISFLIKLTCVVLRNRLSNVARESRKCQAFAHFVHSSGPFLPLSFLKRLLARRQRAHLLRNKLNGLLRKML